WRPRSSAWFWWPVTPQDTRVVRHFAMAVFYFSPRSRQQNLRIRLAESLELWFNTGEHGPSTRAVVRDASPRAMQRRPERPPAHQAGPVRTHPAGSSRRWRFWGCGRGASSPATQASATVPGRSPITRPVGDGRATRARPVLLIGP